jgi:hypothetical protein
MGVELDHLFVCTAAGAPETEQLLQFELREGPANRHSGQGTACRRFAFKNAMLEWSGLSMSTKLAVNRFVAHFCGSAGRDGVRPPGHSGSVCVRPTLPNPRRQPLLGSTGPRICPLPWPGTSLKRKSTSPCGSISAFSKGPSGNGISESILSGCGKSPV